MLYIVNRINAIKKFDVFSKYNVDRYLASNGLVVDEAHRGRKIGEQLVRARQAVCEKYNLKVASTIFTSDASNAIADKIGYELDGGIRYKFKHNKYLCFL